MIDLNCRFILQKGERCGFPKCVEHGMGVRLSLHTDYRPMDCEITYFGDDAPMKPNCWYDGTIYIPYGEAFSPFGQKFPEQICPGEFSLYYASDCVGRCSILSLKKFRGTFEFDD